MERILPNTKMALAASSQGNNSLTRVSAVLATLTFLFSPFIWSYIASVGGLLVRPVDLLLPLIALVFILRERTLFVPKVIPTVLALLALLQILRAISYSDISAFLSSAKILYYLVGAIFLSNVLYQLLKRDFQFEMVFAVFISVPVLSSFLYIIFASFSDAILSGSWTSSSVIIFRAWNEIFSNNLFGNSDLLEVQGVSFRNSSGIAFMIAGIFFLLNGRKFCNSVGLVLMIVAALTFSRSVWLFQSIFLLLLLFTSSRRDKFIGAFVLCIGVYLIIQFPQIAIAGIERAFSDFGRIEMFLQSFQELDKAIIFGRPEGASIVLDDGELRDVHNVPLAFGLKLGVLGLVLAQCVSVIFLVQITFWFKRLFTAQASDRRVLISLIVIASVLSVRPLISASHETFYSIGEWCALALYFALSRKIQRQ